MSANGRTLRGLIDWSYDLLDADERRTFDRFAVFANDSSRMQYSALFGGGGR